MDARSSFVAVAALLWAVHAAHAAGDAFGNPSGCAAYREDWDNASDLMLLVRPGEIAEWESFCSLPSDDFDGEEMIANCSGEGEDWPMTVSITVPETRPDVMIFIEVDEATGRATRTVELWRCP